MKAAKNLYFKELKYYLPLHGKNEKRFISNISQDISLYLEEHPDADYEQLCQAFGKPLDLVHEYMENIDPVTFISQLRIRKHIKIFLTVILLAVCATCFIKSGLYYKSYLDVQNSMPAYYIEVIE